MAITEKFLEDNKHITDEEILIDFYNTEKEIKAYRDIRNGFLSLAELPEARPENNYRWQASKYTNLYIECNEFFENLKEFASARGLL